MITNASITGTEPNPFVAQVDQVTENEWNSMLDRFADASIYQTWAYGAISWGENQLSHLVLYREREPVAMAQMRLVCLPIIRRGIAFLRWGPLCTLKGGVWDEMNYKAITIALIEEYVRRRRLLLRIIPRQFKEDQESITADHICRALGLHKYLPAKLYRTLRLDLNYSLEVLRRQFDQKWRNQLNRAERNGLKIIEGTSIVLYRQFTALYQEMMFRKQFESTVDIEEFGQIQERLPVSQKMKILICTKEGRPMTGLVGSIIGDTGIYLLGATSYEGKKTKGSYLLQWRFLQMLKECGCRWYDLGGINPKINPGVYHFKQGMGGMEIVGFGYFERSDNRLSRACVHVSQRITRQVSAINRFARSGWLTLKNRLFSRKCG